MGWVQVGGRGRKGRRKEVRGRRRGMGGGEETYNIFKTPLVEAVQWEKIFGYLWYHQSDRNHVWNLSEVASLVHTIKHQQVLTCFPFFLVFPFGGEEEAFFLLLASPSALVCDECRAANPGHEEDDGKGASSIYLMIRRPGPALCSAFLLVLKCIALPGEWRQVGRGGWCVCVCGVLSYSGDEVTLCLKVIWSLISSPTPNIFDEEIKSNTYEALGAECLLLEWWHSLS